MRAGRYLANLWGLLSIFHTQLDGVLRAPDHCIAAALINPGSPPLGKLIAGFRHISRGASFGGVALLVRAVVNVLALPHATPILFVVLDNGDGSQISSPTGRGRAK